MNKVIGVAGFKNSGKTTLVEKLVRELTGRGYRISTIKHAHHSFDIDHEGRDSFRHRKAGAREVAVISRERWAIIHEDLGEEPPPLEAILAKLEPCDLVIVEGYKRDTHDKIEVRNLDLAHPVLAGDDPTVVAIAATGPISGAPMPVFDRDDVTALATFIVKHARLPLRPQEVIGFWFEAGPERWFTKDAAFDDRLRARFGEAAAAARDGAYADWAETPEGALGLVLLLDQLPRNIHRGSPLAFASDPRALALAKSAVARGFLQKLTPAEAMWLVLPFEHAEEMAAQDQAVALFQSLGLDEMVHWANVHRDIIARFGRFPHRNPVLGRETTAEEAAFLAAGGFAG